MTVFLWAMMVVFIWSALNRITALVGGPKLEDTIHHSLSWSKKATVEALRLLFAFGVIIWVIVLLRGN